MAALDRRMIVGVGGGYQWVESDDMNFSTEFGLASLYEKFKNQTDSNSELSFQVGYLFDKKLRKWFDIPRNLKCYGAMTLGYQEVRYHRLVRRNPVKVEWR